MFAVSSTVGTNGGNTGDRRGRRSTRRRPARRRSSSSTGSNWTWVQMGPEPYVQPRRRRAHGARLHGTGRRAHRRGRDLTTANGAPATTTTGAGEHVGVREHAEQIRGQHDDVQRPRLRSRLQAIRRSRPDRSASCYANDTTLTGGTANDHAFDMSGNVKEWTLAHEPGENPIRGGASNNTGIGISCPLNFTLGTDTFFFPNVGFRCCR